MLCTEIVSDIQNNFCTQHVLPCSAKRRASDKDLPVLSKFGLKGGISIDADFGSLKYVL